MADPAAVAAGPRRSAGPAVAGAARGWVRPAAAAVILAYLVVATFPNEFRPIVPGLDPSWVYAINRLPYTDALFGRDVVFSFGPLGYLFFPLDMGSNLLRSAVLWVAGQAVIVAIGVHHVRRTRRLEPLLAFGVLLLAAGTVGQLDEYRTLVLLGLALSVAPGDGIAWRVTTAFAAVLAGVLAFTRLSTGVAAVTMLALPTVVWLVRRDIRFREALTFVALPFVATVVVLVVLLFDSPGTVLSWVGASLEYTGGYSESMSYPGPGGLPVLAVAGVAVFVVTAAVLARRAPAVTPVALSFGALLLLGLRHGVVRHHARFVPPIVLGAIAAVVLVAGTRRAAVQGVVAGAVVIGLALGASVVPECFCPWQPERLGPARGWTGLASMSRLEETRERLAAESTVRLAEDRLPRPYRDAAGDGAVDAIPWEIAFLPANDLRWQPNPVIQTYSAYTSSLDRRTADHFASAAAPRSLLVQFVEIDARHPMLVAPAMWRTILERYEPSGLPPARGSWGPVSLFHRRPQPVDLGPRSIATTSARIGRWVEIPRSDGLVFGSIRMEHDLGGRLARLVYRVDPVLLDLRLPTGGVITARFLPSTAENGLLLNRLPMTLEELLGLYAGPPPRKLTAFRIRGPGIGSFQQEFEVAWSEAEWRGSSEAAR